MNSSDSSDKHISCSKHSFITAWGPSPGDLKVLINRLSSLSSSPRGLSVVLRFMVKSLPFAFYAEVPSISKHNFALNRQIDLTIMQRRCSCLYFAYKAVTDIAFFGPICSRNLSYIYSRVQMNWGPTYSIRYL
jgi:hypothetical protein